MKINDIIYEAGDYKIQFISTVPSPGSIIVNGKHTSTAGHKGFKFHLLKKDVFYKSYSVATSYPYNYELIKSSVINVLKNFTI